MLAGIILQTNEILAIIDRISQSYIKNQAVLPGQQRSIPVPFNLNRLTPLSHEIKSVGIHKIDRG